MKKQKKPYELFDEARDYLEVGNIHLANETIRKIELIGCGTLYGKYISKGYVCNGKDYLCDRCLILMGHISDKIGKINYRVNNIQQSERATQESAGENLSLDALQSNSNKRDMGNSVDTSDKPQIKNEVKEE